MTSSSETVWLPSSDESIGPVTILDAQGRVLRVVSAEELRRHGLIAGSLRMKARRDSSRPRGL